MNFEAAQESVQDTNALEESCWDILSETTFLTSDDEGQDDGSESIASYDIQLSDEASDRGTPDAHGDFESDADTPNISATPKRISSTTDSYCQITGRKDLPDHLEKHGSLSILYTRDFSVPHMPKALCDYGRPSLTVSLQQYTSSWPLEVHHPFRILYIGSTPHQMVRRITEKIKSAIAQGDQRYGSREPGRALSLLSNKRPAHVEAASEPGRTEGTGTSLFVDVCRSAYQANDITHLVLDSGTEVKFREREGLMTNRAYKETTYIPNLVVFGHSALTSGEATLTAPDEEGWLPSVRRIIESCKVPKIEISPFPLFLRPPRGYAPGPGDLHLQVSTRSASDEDDLLELLPVDLASFLDIDAGVLNRHISYITNLPAAPSGPDSRFRHSLLSSLHPWGFFGSIRKRNSNYLHQLNWYRAMFRVGILLLVGIATFQLFLWSNVPRSIPLEKISSFGETESKSHRSQQPQVTWNGFTNSGKLLPTLTCGDSALESTLLENRRLNKSILAKPAVTASKIIALGTQSAASDISRRFTVERVGCCHMLLLAHKQNIASRTATNVSLQVSRGPKIVDVKLSKLRESVYAVELNPQDAYGSLLLVLNIWANPNIQERYYVEFGMPWLQSTKWLHAFQEASLKFRADTCQLVFSAKVSVERILDRVQPLRTALVTRMKQTVAKKLASLSDNTRRMTKLKSMNEAPAMLSTIARHIRTGGEETAAHLYRLLGQFERAGFVYNPLANNMASHVPQVRQIKEKLGKAQKSAYGLWVKLNRIMLQTSDRGAQLRTYFG